MCAEEKVCFEGAKPGKKWTSDGDMWPQRPVPSPHPPKKAPMTHSTSECAITQPLCHVRAQKCKPSDSDMHTRDRTQSFIILFRAAISITSALGVPHMDGFSCRPDFPSPSPSQEPPLSLLHPSPSFPLHPCFALYSLSRATARTGVPLYLLAKWK